MNLHDLWEKCKSEDVYTALVVILVGFSSFGLGRLSIQEQNKAPIIIEEPNAGAVILSDDNKTAGVKKVPNGVQISSGGQLVASKSGTKYHFPWCAGAKSISEGNKIWFNSEGEARDAGYTPASNCKGLK